MSRLGPDHSDEAALKTAVALGTEFVVNSRKRGAVVYDFAASVARRSGDFEKADKLTTLADKSARQAHMFDQKPDGN